MQSGIFLPAGTALSNKTEFFRVSVGILLCTGRNSFVYRLEFFCVPTGILSCTSRNSFVYRSEFFRVPIGILSCTDRNSFVYRPEFFRVPTSILLHAGRDQDIQACRTFLMCGRGDSGLFLYRQRGKEHEFRPWSAGLLGDVGVGLVGIPFRPKETPNTTANLALLWREFAVRSLKACPQSESGSGHVFGGTNPTP